MWFTCLPGLREWRHQAQGEAERWHFCHQRLTRNRLGTRPRISSTGIRAGETGPTVAEHRFDSPSVSAMSDPSEILWNLAVKLLSLRALKRLLEVCTDTCNTYSCRFLANLVRIVV